LLLLGGCASLPENVDRKASFAMKDTTNTWFWRRFGVGLLRLLPIESQLQAKSPVKCSNRWLEIIRAV
jgi:hypothetical protein